MSISDRFRIKLIPDGTWLASFLLQKTSSGVRLDIGDTPRAAHALAFDMTSADYLAGLLSHLGHAAQVLPIEDECVQVEEGEQ